MAPLRVLVSSTAYDLEVLRSSLRRFIENLGFEPVLSEYSEVLYDPREHTHRSCLNEVKNCDILVLIIGSRFGSELSEEETRQLSRDIDSSLLEETSSGPRLSITQGEALTAVTNGIPVFAFIESGVNHDYMIYKHNKGKPFVSEIEYASISRPGTAEHIFSFIEYFQGRQTNNALIVFEKIDDIFTHLSKQWAALFQRLLSESRTQRDEAVRIDRLADQFEDLKTALLSTVGVERRQVARAAIRFRRMVAFLKGLPNSDIPVRQIISQDGTSWEELLSNVAGITAVEPMVESHPPWLCILRRGLTEPYLCQQSAARIAKFGFEWSDFMKLDSSAREVVYDELIDTMQPSDLVIVSPASVEPRIFGAKEGVAERFLPRVREREAPIVSTEGSYRSIVPKNEISEKVVASDDVINPDEGGEA